MSKCWMVALALLLLGCQVSEEEQDAPETATGEEVAPPAAETRDANEAVLVAENLKAGGLPLTLEITGAPGENEGIVSKAMSGTDSSDMVVEVYESAEKRNAARLRLISGGPIGYLAECGPILVIFPRIQESETVRLQRKHAQQILEDHYGPC